jgi:hypothetical protein
MDKITRYKRMYPDPNGLENMILKDNGTVDIPKWLALLLIHNSGLKAKSKRKIKKRLKREVVRLITSGMAK